MTIRTALIRTTVAAAVCGFVACGVSTAQTIGPWTPEDMTKSVTASDDRPNANSVEIVQKNYAPIVDYRLFLGEKKVYGFRVAPRNERYAGILITTPEGKPMKKADMEGMSVQLNNAAPASTAPSESKDGGKGRGRGQFEVLDTVLMYSDASRIFPKTEILVLKGTEVVDRAVIDFSQWKLIPSKIQMGDFAPPLLDKGFVRPKGLDFVRDDGKKMFFWGGHENHIPGYRAKDPAAGYRQSDLYAETYHEAGINVQRHIGMSEMLDKDGKIDPQKLDQYFYLVYALGQKGVYFFMSDDFGNMIDMDWRAHRKAFWKELLTTVNPYTKKALKDDPTIIGFELTNETGLNERRFDYNKVGSPDTPKWRKIYNDFLIKKYGSREALAAAWEAHPLMPHEDPAKGTIVIPSNFRGVRLPYGGGGGHDQTTTGRWCMTGKKYWLPPEYNPRILDAIEFNKTVAKKTYPFDFNNATTPEETQKLRLAFNDFLMAKYGSREALDKAWANDHLFPLETPAEGIDKKTNKVDPKLPQKTILIPTNYLGQDTYEQDDARRSDPRISDMIECTYEVQKGWATDLANYLRNDVGMKCAIGWNGDTFQVCQVPNHKANMDSPLSLTLSACYCDSDNGDQLTSRTKNLKRFLHNGYIYERPTFAYEWGGWTTMGPFQYEYILQGALMSRVYGFDGLAHHKMSAMIYPISDPVYSLKVHYITPISDRPRRGAFSVGRWIQERSKIADLPKDFVIGYPDGSSFTAGADRRMSSPGFENWIMYQLPTVDYSFKEVYDGPKDRIVIHEGRGPYGDYSAAKHAVLWCYSDSSRDGKDMDAKKKWFAKHGIVFKPGEKYYLDDKYFATLEDPSEYNVTHAKAERARWDIMEKIANPLRTGIYINDDYWAAEPNAQPTELDRQLYQAFKRWGYKMPFAENEIDKVWRGDGMSMDTTKLEFLADRDDMQLRFGKGGKGTQVKLSRLEASSDEHQYAIALLPWDTGDFKTAKTLAVWCMWDGDVKVKADFAAPPKIYAVGWLGTRLFEVRPTDVTKNSVSFKSARHDDIFCYEIVQE